MADTQKDNGLSACKRGLWGIVTMFTFVFCLISFACMHSVPLLYACPSGYTILRSDGRSRWSLPLCQRRQFYKQANRRSVMLWLTWNLMGTVAFQSPTKKVLFLNCRVGCIPPPWSKAENNLMREHLLESLSLAESKYAYCPTIVAGYFNRLDVK